MVKLCQKEKDFYKLEKSAHYFYLEALLDAIKFVYSHSGEYFRSTSGRERSMVFRIAHHLANKIEGEGVFVDLEPTKCNGINKTCQYEDENKEHRIIPDLIIHRRIRPGYLVAEFKCSPDNWEHDYDKLEKLTTTLAQRRNDTNATYTGTPYYELGVFVYLKNYSKEVKIDVFAHGKKQATLSLNDI